MRKDLGTYHVRVELVTGHGWIEKWETGLRFAGGSATWSPLNAQLIQHPWKDEASLFEAIVYQHTRGNSSCDCNKRLSIRNAYQQSDVDESECGDTMPLRRLTAIRPDASEVVVYPQQESKLEGLGEQPAD